MKYSEDDIIFEKAIPKLFKTIPSGATFCDENFAYKFKHFYDNHPAIVTYAYVGEKIKIILIVLDNDLKTVLSIKEIRWSSGQKEIPSNIHNSIPKQIFNAVIYPEKPNRIDEDSNIWLQPALIYQNLLIYELGSLQLKLIARERLSSGNKIATSYQEIESFDKIEEQIIGQIKDQKFNPYKISEILSNYREIIYNQN